MPTISKNYCPFKEGNTRYLTLTHYYNYGIPLSRIHIFTSGLIKLINSLSWMEQGHIPQIIGQSQTILKIDLQELGWTSEIWDRLVEIYPYNLTTADLPVERFEELSGTRLPYLRGDWFAFETSRPPLYYEILELPSTEHDLETTGGPTTHTKSLYIDVKENIEQGLAARAGFQVSGVSVNNRLIERHPSPFGAYWKSYDFKKDDGDESRILFSFPLGPSSYERSSFRHDGGEMIFNLPNGLQAYFLSDARGRRLDEGPLDIVQDKDREDRVVRNGISCMSCHADGMRKVDDEIRNYVVNSGNFPASVVERVKKLHPEKEVFDQLLEQDIEMFYQAQRNLGLDPELRDQNGFEPISSLVYDFEAPVKFDRAAAELGLSSASFDRLLDQNRRLKALSLRLKGAGIPRNEFINFFDEFSESFYELDPDFKEEVEIGDSDVQCFPQGGLRHPSHTASMIHFGRSFERDSVRSLGIAQQGQPFRVQSLGKSHRSGHFVKERSQSQRSQQA